MTDTLTKHIQKMQKGVSSFRVQGIDEDKRELTDGQLVEMAQVINECVIHIDGEEDQRRLVSGQVATWGWIAARAQRVYERTEALYRRWREGEFWKAKQPPEDPEAAKKWKKPTDKEAEATYRLHPEYEAWQFKIERAREAWNQCEAIVEGFKAKKDVMRRTQRRMDADEAPNL
jgi:hypothetical protein